MAKLSKEEKSAQDFIQMSFALHKRGKAGQANWVKTAERLNHAIKGRHFGRHAERDRFVVNEAFSLVNLILPNFIFQQPHIKVSPQNARYFREKNPKEVEQTNNIKMARNMEAVINHHYKKTDAILEDRKALQDALIYPFGVVKDGYSFETISKDDKDFITKDTGFHKRINPQDFGWHPMATGPDDSIKLVHRTTMSRVQAEKKGIKNVSEMENGIPEHIRKRINSSTGNSKGDGADFGEDFLTFNEVHDQEADMVYLFGGTNNILADKQKRGYDFLGSDFSVIRFTKDNDDFKGIPMLAMVEPQMNALNEISTLIVEHFRKFPGQIFMGKESADEDQIEKIRTGEQGSIHVVNSVNEVLRTSPLQMGQEYFQIVNLMFSLIDRVLGIPDFQRASGSGRRSATEASFIQGDATVRRNYFLGLVKDFVLEGVQKQAALKQQFQDEKEVIQATGELQFEQFEVNKEDIQGEFMFNFDVDNMTATNEAQFNNINNLLTIMGQNPFFQQAIQKLDPDMAAKKLFSLVNLEFDSLTQEKIQDVVHVAPDRENEIAEQGDLMPRPKKAEDFETHLRVHREFVTKRIQDLGGPTSPQAAEDPVIVQVIEHIAETEALANPQPQQAPGAAPGEEQTQQQAAQPAGPRGPLRSVAR